MFVEEDASRAIAFSSASGHLSNGVLTLDFSNGNEVTISNVSSGGLTALNQSNQLVSAMASYSSGVVGVSPTLQAQTGNELPLFSPSQH